MAFRFSSIQKKEAEKDKVHQLVNFRLGEEEFGVEILNTRSIVRMMEITKLPETPEYILGIIILQGQVIPILDLRTRLRIKSKPYDCDTRIIIAEFEKLNAGFIVDSVREVLRIKESSIKPPPDNMAGLDTMYITSIARHEGRLIVILDFSKILSKNESRRLEEISKS